jgi:hypothetical protein
MTAAVAPAHAQVVTYEANDFPEQFGWERRNNWPDRMVENGWFIQTFREEGQDFYRYDIGGISGLVGRFFVEWRAMSNYPEWLIYEWQTPAALSSAGRAASLYHVVMTESAAVLLRDVSIPRVIVPISVGEPHTYRVEVYADEYIWYTDGAVEDSGVPEGPYPDLNAFVIWGSRRNGVEGATTAWCAASVGNGVFGRSG